ncbi:hypothetical protein C8D77_101229 [Mesorhizobium loti]|uniref:Uncharacterized protein n=1 Tax=Rhizobium loti TaxID=381 RepID=A0A8E2WID8_RHILI|nr:hypothetical protein [Mesorhizobium loti]PWJ93550.1 hypothetical protein C8D77_101229 [Mesorhizobium loti]
MRHRCDIFKVAEQCGIRLLHPADHRPLHRRPRECFAKKTLKKIGQRHGEAHLALTLRLIVETYGNAAELYSETIQAVSALVANPSIEARGGALFEQFDRISLGEVRHQAKGLAVGLPLAHVMRVLLAVRLSDGIVRDDRRAA